MILEPVALIHTGNDLIDTQHRELIELLNMLMLGIEAKDHPRIQKSLQGLTRYVVEHFTDEEALHQNSGMGGFSEHQMAHHKIIGDLDRFVQAYNRYPDSEVQNMQLLFTVVRDFMQQLEHHDVPLAVYVRTHPESVSTK